jgi:hypothetical protein
MIISTVGLLLGCLLSFAVLNRRYTIVVSADSDYAIRLDKWTGQMYVLQLGSSVEGFIDERKPR